MAGQFSKQISFSTIFPPLSFLRSFNYFDEEKKKRRKLCVYFLFIPNVESHHRTRNMEERIGRLEEEEFSCRLASRKNIVERRKRTGGGGIFFFGQF